MEKYFYVEEKGMDGKILSGKFPGFILSVKHGQDKFEGFTISGSELKKRGIDNKLDKEGIPILPEGYKIVSKSKSEVDNILKTQSDEYFEWRELFGTAAFTI